MTGADNLEAPAVYDLSIVAGDLDVIAGELATLARQAGGTTGDRLTSLAVATGRHGQVVRVIVRRLAALAGVSSELSSQPETLANWGADLAHLTDLGESQDADMAAMDGGPAGTPTPGAGS